MFFLLGSVVFFTFTCSRVAAAPGQDPHAGTTEGLCSTKRLERGRFRLPEVEVGAKEVRLGCHATGGCSTALT